MPTSIRIGAGAGFAADRIEPAVDLAARGQLDFLVLETLAERTIALAHLRRMSGADAGFDPMLEERMEALLGHCFRNSTRIISNMGAANPRAAALTTVAIARRLGLHGMRVAFVEGDNVLDALNAFEPFEDEPLMQDRAPLSASAYLGAEPIVEALDSGSHVVITGRSADPSLFLGAFMHSFQWQPDNWQKLGAGTVVGHLLECAGQLTGGYFADPGYKDVPGLERLGFPFADVASDGSAVLQKLDDTGGLLSLQTCREQLLYEVLDPAAYLTPDVTADFTTVHLEAIADNQVRVSGGTGRKRPDRYKVSVGYRNGFFGEGQITYAGAGAVQRAELAQAILRQRLQQLDPEDLRFDLIGLNSLHGPAAAGDCIPYEVRLRGIGRFRDAKTAERATREVESLYVNGPAGGGGVTTSMRESIAILPALLARTAVRPTVSYEVA